MQPAHDEYEALSDEQRRGGQHQSPYETILAKSGLAMHLRDIFEVIVILFKFLSLSQIKMNLKGIV
jgi:hypothetical protein